MEVLVGVARQNPQTYYDGMQKYLNQEWDFAQHVTPHIGEAFQPADEALEKFFLPALFQGATRKVPTLGITLLPYNQAGIAIPNLNLLAWDNWAASCVITRYLVAALRGRTYFKRGYHTLILREGHGDIRIRKTNDAKMALEEALADATALDDHQLRRGTKTEE